MGECRDCGADVELGHALDSVVDCLCGLTHRWVRQDDRWAAPTLLRPIADPALRRQRRADREADDPSLPEARDRRDARAAALHDAESLRRRKAWEKRHAAEEAEAKYRFNVKQERARVEEGRGPGEYYTMGEMPIHL
jgi:hypothetical protein